MAYQKKGQQDKSFIADTLADLEKIPICSMGSTCYIIETSEKYMINSEGKWILQVSGSNKNPTIIDGSADGGNIDNDAGSID